MNYSIQSQVKATSGYLNRLGLWLADVPLRLFLAWEFFDAGLEKWHGENWFAQIQSNFPLPFNVLPVNLNWQLSMWAELIAPVLILLGFGTRLASIVLIVLTIVATAAVHWPAEWSSLSELWRGYAITDKGFGNFKLPLLFAAMLLPLVFHGAGRFSLDALLAAGTGTTPRQPLADPKAWALALAVLALPALMLVPVAGLVLAILAVLLLAAGWLWPA